MENKKLLEPSNHSRQESREKWGRGQKHDDYLQLRSRKRKEKSAKGAEGAIWEAVIQVKKGT